MERRAALAEFYGLLDELRQRLGGFRYLKDCDARSGWPAQGVYFFFEPGEYREDGNSLRVVRVGTHGVSEGSRTTLWNRLAQHRGRVGGSNPGGGNHRGSIFRLHIGTALLNRDDWPEEIRASWDRDDVDSKEARLREYPLERAVSEYIGKMPFLWLAVPGPAGRDNDRKLIETGAVALLSNYGREPVDAPSQSWLGGWADREAVRRSELWNVNHVTDSVNLHFFGALKRHIGELLRPPTVDSTR